MTDSKTITIYGADWCGDCRRSKALLDSLGVAYTYIDVEHDSSGADAALAISGRTSIPVVAFPDGTHQVEPTNLDLESKLREVGALV